VAGRRLNTQRNFAATFDLTMKALRRGFGCRYAAKVSTHILQPPIRHANLKVTMTYYANIDVAVAEAILGAQRTSLPTSQPEPLSQAELGNATNSSPVGPNSP